VRRIALRAGEKDRGHAPGKHAARGSRPRSAPRPV